MPKWTHELRFIDLMNAPCEQADWPTAESEESAESLCAAHNADIDALEAEIAELRKLVQDYQRHGVIIDDMEDRERDAELAAANATLEKLREVVPSDCVQCTKCPSTLDAYYLGCGEFKCEDCQKDFSLFDLIEKLRAILYPPTENTP